VSSEHADEDWQTPQEQWEEHNELFNYEPPQKPPESWSSDEYQELHDRVIRRRTQWFCDKCSGRGPMGSLQKARRHVQNHHSPDLVERYAPDEDELETATDGGASKDRTEKRTAVNHCIGDFSGGADS
jgi:TPP-dependent indolepyruvate ferredoxin oxidoreductase alpha subunit